MREYHAYIWMYDESDQQDAHVKAWRHHKSVMQGFNEMRGLEMQSRQLAMQHAAMQNQTATSIAVMASQRSLSMVGLAEATFPRLIQSSDPYDHARLLCGLPRF